MDRTFTSAEANAALAELRPVVERMVEHRRRLEEAQRQHEELVVSITGNGGDLRPSDLHEAAAALEQAAAVVAECVPRINDAGALVKELDEGLIDFPARRGGEVVLLCWRLGEDEIGFWHGLEEGFAGRKPLPL